jgi:hypothetical protein
LIGLVADQQLAPKSTTTAAPDVEAKPAVPAQTGAGVAALTQLIQRGQPAPAAVVQLIDAHRTERDAMINLLQQTLGNSYVQQVVTAMNKLRVSVPNQEVVDGDPANPSAGYVLASGKEQDARWQTANGDFSGKIDQTGLDAKEQLGANNDLHATVDAKKQQGALAWDHDGKDVGELFGGTQTGGWDAGIRKSESVDGATVTEALQHSVKNNVATDGVEVDASKGADKLAATAGVSEAKPVGSFDETHTFADGSTAHGNVTHDATSTSATVDGTDKLSKDHALTGSLNYTNNAKGNTETLKAGFTDPTTSVNGSLVDTNGVWTGALAGTQKLGANDTMNGSVTRNATSTAISVGDAYNFNKTDNVSGSITGTHDDVGTNEFVGKVHEQYGNAKLLESTDLEAGTGKQDYMKATGSLEGQLSPSWYAGGWGTVDAEQGKPTTGSLGASVTFTPDEKNALTLAGIVNQDGALETRLQYDLFKTKVDSVAELSQEKKDAVVSLFVSYTTKATNAGMLDDRFGAPAESIHAGNQVMAGIRIKF